MKFNIASAIILLFLTGFACKKSDIQPVPRATTIAFFAKGADVSWLTQMENAGVKFYNSTGTETECMQLLKNNGVNSIRLIWNPRLTAVGRVIHWAHLTMQANQLLH